MRPDSWSGVLTFYAQHSDVSHQYHGAAQLPVVAVCAHILHSMRSVRQALAIHNVRSPIGSADTTHTGRSVDLS